MCIGIRVVDRRECKTLLKESIYRRVRGPYIYISDDKEL